jgi:alpha-L-arabinofuranosidase
VLTGGLTAVNTFENPDRIVLKTDLVTVAGSFECELPPDSLAVIRLKSK